MKKIIFNTLQCFSVSALFLSACTVAYGQAQKSEFSIHAGGLFSYIDYNLEQGDAGKGNGGAMGFRYLYYLDNNWGIGIGAEYQSYKTTARFSTFKGEYTTADVENESFQFRYAATNFREEQKLGYLNIPVNVQYESSGLTRFYASAGAKIGFAVNGSYETSVGDLNTSGYYPQYDAELFAPEFMGFGALGKVDAGKQDLKTKMACSFTFEAGIKQVTGDKSSIYVGLFVDYGLNNIYKKEGSKNVIEYTDEAPVDMKYNSVLDSGNTGEAKIIAYGFKVRVGIL